MPLNERLLRVAVAKQAERVLIKKVRPLIELDYESKKEQFIEAFNSDPVTQEIEGGPSAFSNIGPLATAGGNLFSFLGFEAGKEPVGALREYLTRSIELGRTRAGVVKGSKVVFSTPVAFPTVAEVDAFVATNSETKLDWDRRPFTSVLANGVPGLPNFIFDEEKGFASSRSGPAIQSKGKVRNGSLGPIPYIGPLLANLKRLFGPKR